MRKQHEFEFIFFKLTELEFKKLKNDEWMQPNWHHVLHTLQSNLKASHVTVKTLVVMFIGLYMV